MKSTTTDKIIASLKKMFLIHGLPISISSDNGPQFISHEFMNFVREQYIFHRKTTPPQANGEIEIKITQIEKKDLKEELASYLMMYRTTPHSTTGVSPSKLLFHRKLRKRLAGRRIKIFAIMTMSWRKKGSCTSTKKGAKEIDLRTADVLVTHLRLYT